MKSKTSFFNKTIFLKNITHFWPIWGLLLLFHLFLLPVSLYADYHLAKSNFNAEQFAESIEHSVILPELTYMFVNPTIVFIFSLIAAGAVFYYLYTPRSANAMHAFPVTRASLFITNYLSGLAFLWIPQTLGTLLGILVAAGCGYPYIEILFQGFLLALGLSFFFYSFHVFIGMFVGQLIALPVFTCIINVLFVGVKFILYQLFGMFSYGLSGEYQNSRWDALSPLYYLVKNVDIVIDYRMEYSVCTGITGAKTVIGYVIAAVVLVVLAFLLYRRQDIEMAGNLISVKWVTPVFRFGVGGCFGCVAALFAGSIISNVYSTSGFLCILIVALVVGAVCFFAAEMLLQKSFRVFQKARFRECAIFAAALAVVLLCVRADLFGIEDKIPDAGEVAGAYIRSTDYVGGVEEEDIAQIIALHENILSHKSEYQSYKAESWWEWGYGVGIKYYMKDGSQMYRNYIIPAEEEQFADSTSPVNQILDIIADQEHYKKSVLGINYEGNEYISGSMSFINSVSRDDDGNEVGESSEVRDLTQEQANAICQAFLKDVEAGHFREQIRLMAKYDDGYRKLVYWSSIDLDYTNAQRYEDYSDKFYYGIEDRDYIYNSNMGTAYITFNTECEYLIAALIEEGVIHSADELATLWDVSPGEIDYYGGGYVEADMEPIDAELIE